MEVSNIGIVKISYTFRHLASGGSQHFFIGQNCKPMFSEPLLRHNREQSERCNPECIARHLLNAYMSAILVDVQRIGWTRSASFLPSQGPMQNVVAEIKERLLKATDQDYNVRHIFVLSDGNVDETSVFDERKKFCVHPRFRCQLATRFCLSCRTWHLYTSREIDVEGILCRLLSKFHSFATKLSKTTVAENIWERDLF